MELEPFANFTICPVCAGLAGYPPGREAYPQVCRCHRQGEVRWPDHDYNEYADLCWCCQMELILSGSKWSPFYCEACRPRVRAYNEAAGRLVFLVGRHSLMNGVGLRGSDAGRPEAVRAFARALHGFALGGMGFFDTMGRWRPARLEAVRQAVSLPPGDGTAEAIGLTGYLASAEGLRGDRSVGQRAAFDTLCDFMGCPRFPEEE